MLTKEECQAVIEVCDVALKSGGLAVYNSASMLLAKAQASAEQHAKQANADQVKEPPNPNASSE